MFSPFRLDKGTWHNESAAQSCVGGVAKRQHHPNRHTRQPCNNQLGFIPMDKAALYDYDELHFTARNAGA